MHQWFIELLRRFSLQFAILTKRCASIENGGDEDSVILEEDKNKNTNPFLDDQLVLASVGLLADDEHRASQALEAGWDMLIVDEAHHLEWTKDQVSKEYQMVEKLASRIPSLLLLTRHRVN